MRKLDSFIQRRHVLTGDEHQGKDNQSSGNNEFARKGIPIQKSDRGIKAATKDGLHDLLRVRLVTSQPSKRAGTAARLSRFNSIG
jgi:hypothetical protein